MYLKFIVAMVLFGALIMNANAEDTWVNGFAKINVQNLPIDQIRAEAIREAIVNASYNGGVTVSSQDIMLNGLLVESTVSLETNNKIEQVEVVNESLIDGVLSVWVRVKIFKESHCSSRELGKHIIVSQFSIQNAEHVVVGELEDLAEHVTKRFQEQIGTFFNRSTISLLNESISSNNTLAPLNIEETFQKAKYLGRRHGAQFTIHGVIRDMSIFERFSKVGVLEQDEIFRNFTIRLFIFDNYRGELVFEDSFHTESIWPFSLRQNVDLTSSVFWNAEYGRAILNSLNLIASEVRDKLQCVDVLYPITEVAADGLVIHVGTDDGLQLNDVFVLVKTKETNVSFSTVELKVLENSELRISRIGTNYSILRRNVVNGSAGAQVFDYVKLAKKQ